MTSNDESGRIGGHTRWFLLGVATVAQVVVAIIRLGIPALMPFIRQDLGLDRTQVGFISSVLNGGAAAAGIPAGIAVDRFGERLVLGYGAIGSGLVVLGVSAGSSFAALLPILLVTGFLTTTSVPAGGKVVARWFRDTERGTTMGIRQMGVPLGGAIAAIALPPLALATSWQISLSVAGVLAILVGIAALCVYKEPPEATHGEEQGRRTGVKALLARNDIRAVLAFVFLFGAGQWCYLTYLTLYLTEAINMSVVVAGTLLAVGQLCGTLGRVGWGLASDRLFRGRRRPVLLIIGALAVITTLGISMMSTDTPFFVITGIVAVLGLSLQGWNGLTHTLASELAGAKVAGVAVGMTNSVGFLGVMFLPPVFGAVVDWTDSYRAAWLVLAMLLFAASCMLFGIGEPSRRDAGG